MNIVSLKKFKIYPIKYNGEKFTSVKKNKRDSKAEKNFKIAPGLKVAQIISKSKAKKIKEIIEELFDENVPEEYSNVKNIITVFRYCGSNNINLGNTYLNICLKNYGQKYLFERLKIKKNNQQILQNFFKKFCKLYIKEELCKEVIEEISYTFIRYQGKNKGLIQHVDSLFFKVNGPFFIINLNPSILDLVPYKEILKNKKEYRPFRIFLDPGDIVIADGDARTVYTHGVPKDFEFENNIRYAIVLRFPKINKNKNKLCKLTDYFNKEFQGVLFKNNKKLIPCNSELE